ncbi:hypothetical protein [Kordiimonas lacus]|uniref:hypothetical protein n=1 Tax=Kordiimonas lacus TaxID=637679 RepID=UPI00083693A6|nr:hypothetical protein [Kordiimonas lacus]
MDETISGASWVARSWSRYVHLFLKGLDLYGIQAGACAGQKPVKADYSIFGVVCTLRPKKLTIAWWCVISRQPYIFGGQMAKSVPWYIKPYCLMLSLPPPATVVFLYSGKT